MSVATVAPIRKPDSGPTGESPPEEVGFGTFGGVFTPCTLTILGVIMFLRFGYVVGQAGLWYSLAIVLAAKMITVLTSLSLSAIATNTRVKGGGAYYLISRSLGAEFGGAIGLVFYLAQAISASMYAIGFAEAFTATFPELGLSVVGAATITNVVVFICVYIGAGWTIKVQYFILAALAASLVSFFLGAAQAFDVATLEQNALPHFSPGEGLFSTFALFFPAVTGIMAGANMSGDLRSPSRSIPTGTLGAVFVTLLIYLGMAVMLAASRPHDVLASDLLVVSSIARWPVLITAGIFAATLSSALGSMMGAPRILQAFARDDVSRTLRPFAATSGENGEPRRATVLTFVVAQTCILVADLDTIAPLITMFFMITYGLLNMATFYEAITRNPSYRPRFRLCHWSSSLLGALGCLAAMVLIDWVWALASIVLVAALHAYIGRKEIEARWGDLQSGLLFERTRRNLLRLEDELQHPKNWRPNILALSDSEAERRLLGVYGHWLTSGHGLLTLGRVIQGDVDENLGRRLEEQRDLQRYISDEGLEAFASVVVAPTHSEGVDSLTQVSGIGSIQPNTVLLGWPSDLDGAAIFGATIRTAAGLGRSIVATRFPAPDADVREVGIGTIDVWWYGPKNGELMLLLAHLLAKNNEWRGRSIRLLRVAPNEADRVEVTRHLEELIDRSRIRARAHVVVSSDAREAIQATSASAAIVILGFEVPEIGREEAFYGQMERWAGGLERVLFVDSIGGMSLED